MSETSRMPDAVRAVEQSVGGVLLPTLELAVAVQLSELQLLDAATRDVRVRAWVAAAVDPIASQGDALMFGGRRGTAATVFAHLARALAALATLPGGVTFAGRHWCADHATCRAADPPAAAGDGCRGRRGADGTVA